jgi:dihydrofolate synthase/folylpolyglutamate synthase
LYGEGGILLFGCAADKDAAAMAKIAHSHFAKIIITTPGTFKISDPVKVHEAFREEEVHTEAHRTFGSRHREERKIILIKKTEEAIKRAIEYAETQNLPILGTGSFYLVSEIRKHVWQ